jgi:hypothetical protein
MEEKPEPAEQPTERKQADSAWVLPPDVPSGTSIELATLTKVNHSTPEMLELLQRLMLTVQESEAANEHGLEACESFKRCDTYNAPSCGRLEDCTTFKRLQ